MNETILRKIADRMSADVDEDSGAYDGDPPIMFTPGASVVQFKLQDGPIREVGKNGCQVDDVIRFAMFLLEEFNGEFPCKENVQAIAGLDTALKWLWMRHVERVDRGVEGRNKP